MSAVAMVMAMNTLRRSSGAEENRLMIKSGALSLKASGEHLEQLFAPVLKEPLDIPAYKQTLDQPLRQGKVW